MKALFTPRLAIEKAFTVLAFLPLVFLVYPEASYAATTSALVVEENKPLVFQVQNPKLLENQSTLTFDQLVQQDPLVVKVQTYLENHNSPLAVYAPEIVKLDNWKESLSISFVESNFGKYCFQNNCSGIGGAPGMPTWRVYPSKLDWFIDLNNLLEKPVYKDKTFKQMNCVYVQPCSANWVRGTEKVFSDLTTLETQAQTERQQNAQVNTKGNVAAAVTTVELVKLK